jgi:excisionase family DNA binding protein
MRPDSDMVDPLLSVGQVAQRLDVQPVTVYRWCRSGRLRCLKPGKAWRIRQADLEAFLAASKQPRTLTEHLGHFLLVPDQVVAVAEDPDLLARFAAAFFQIGASRDGILVKIDDPNVCSRDLLAAALRAAGLPVGHLEQGGRLHWLPTIEMDAGLTGLERILADEDWSASSIWATLPWPSGDEMAAGGRQQARLASLIAAHPRLVVATTVIKPDPTAWPPLAPQERLMHSLRGVIRLARAGLVLARVVAPLPA